MRTPIGLLFLDSALLLAACSANEAPAGADTPGEGANSPVSDTGVTNEVAAASSNDAASSTPPGDILDQCRSRAASEYAVAASDVATLEPQSDRVDGTFPVNGSLSDGRRFQCNFSAASELTDFVKVEDAAPAPSSSGLEDFEGARAGQAEMGIQRLGYELARSEGLTNFWLNASAGQCYAITTSDGRYSKVQARPRSDCD